MIDLTGQTFFKLTVIKLSGKRESASRDHLWRCACECGRIALVTARNLKHKTRPVKSCGCYRHHFLATMAQKIKSEKYPGRYDGSSKTREYFIWSSMVGRCENARDKRYRSYGGRGIVVCRRWRDSFKAFLSDVGKRPSGEMTLGRIDNDKGYEPGNVRWETRKQQMRNTRNSRLVFVGGRKRPLAELVEAYSGLTYPGREYRNCYARVLARLERGWSALRALTEPARRYAR